jgi:aryl-alcohol dehydrogenase-like predicted oxidoreductase
MLYRPYGLSGIALSAVSLRISWEAANNNTNKLKALITAALENGINAYHFDYIDADMMRCAAEVFSIVKRPLLFLSATAHSAPRTANATSYAYEPLRARLKVAVKECGFDYLDMVQFYNPINSGTPDESWAFMKSLREARMVRAFGAEAPDEDLAPLIRSSQFQIVRTAFDLDTTWEKRNLLDLAQSRGITIFGSDYFPEAYRRKENVVPKAARGGWFRKASNPEASLGTYAFLYTTSGWCAEELCLGYALHQTGLTTVMIEADNVAQVNLLASVPGRYLPPSVPAQIEMARFNDRSHKRA